MCSAIKNNKVAKKAMRVASSWLVKLLVECISAYGNLMNKLLSFIGMSNN